MPRWKKSEAEGEKERYESDEEEREEIGRTRKDTVGLADEAGVSRLRKREGGRERASLGLSLIHI